MLTPPIISASWGVVILSTLIVVPSLVFIALARRKKFIPPVRRIRGVDMVDEAIGRSIEMGRPMVMTVGSPGIGPLLLAVMGIMGHIARAAAKFRQRFFVPQNDVTVMALVSEYLNEVYRDAGRPELFRMEMTPYLSDQQFSYASGYMGLVHREKAGACFLIGSFAAESLILAEAGQQIGAMQVSGTVDYSQIPFLITSTDYTLVGEEVYAAGAYLSDDPVQKGSVAGQDAAKAVLIALFLTGVIWATIATIWHRDETPQVKSYDVSLSQVVYPPPKDEGENK